MAEQGNVAAMREALMDIVLLTVKAGKYLPSDVACGIIASKAKRALSLPPRNCDRYTTVQDAVNAFKQHLEKCKVLATTSYEAIVDHFLDWLFAKEEGGVQ